MGAIQMTYFDALCSTMKMLARHPRVLFIGQGVGCAGTALTDTLAGIPDEKLIEFPVAEDLQLGFATGLALEGFIPVCIFPRWNFLLCAANQLVNHLDKLHEYSDGGFNPIVIIRTTVPSRRPFDPGPQHDGDFTAQFRQILKHVRVEYLTNPQQVIDGYQRAFSAPWPTLLVEDGSQYAVRPSGVPAPAMSD